MKVIKVTAGVITDDNKVLITRGAPKENFAGGWEFPGENFEGMSASFLKNSGRIVGKELDVPAKL